MIQFQEAVFRGLHFLQEMLLVFTAGHLIVSMMIGGAIGGGFILGIVKRGLSNALVGAIGGASAVLILWGMAKMLVVAFGGSPV